MEAYADPPGMPDDERMTGVELKTIREWLGVGIDWLAEYLDVSPRTVRHWEAGRNTIPDGARSEVERLEAVTAQYVAAGVETLKGDSDPAVVTYYSNEQYRQAYPEETWPATWHRRVVARIAQEVPGLVIISPPNNDE